MAKLIIDRELLRQTMRGYKEMNRFVEAELKAKLPHITPQESLDTFNGLYDAWERSGKLAGGSMERFAQERVEEKIRLRQAFELLARKQGYH